MKKRVMGVILATAMIFSILPAREFSTVSKAKSTYEGTANLRIFSTSDLHGQSTTFSYDTASLHKNGSLAQISQVIKDSKKTLKNGNSLLVDVGDTIFGMGAKAIKEKRVPISSDEQYMYKLMKYMGYDAITPGNHDFDYGYSYEKKILKASGLSPNTVLCNVRDAKTKKFPWSPRKIIKKKVKTTKGKECTIKIGITGAVEPGLSTYTPWKDVLEVTDVVEAVEEQVELLKEEGANIVVVLAHSGIGPEEYEEMGENVAYQLTEIDGVNVICAGHTHKNYPVKDEEYTKSIKKMSGVASSGKINGKIVVQEEDHGQAVGITDLKFSFTNGKPKLIKKDTSVRKITENDPEDSAIIKKNTVYDEAFKELFENSEAACENSHNNYFGMLEDNALVQITNDAKIAHAQKVIKDNAPEYAGCPIIASTTYYQAGGDAPDNYIKSSGEIKLKDLLNVQMYAQEWAKFYYITGAQLKEALEWQASAYMSPDEDADSIYVDPKLNEQYAAGMSPILSPEWEKWEGLSIFDGVEYVIDVSGEPRYNKAGKLINSDSHRIKSLTRDGKEIKDTDKLVWVTRNMTTTHWPMIGEAVQNQLIVKKTKQMAEIIEDYVKEQESFGTLSIKADDNWRVEFPEGANYIVKTSSAASEFVSAKEWYVDTVASENGYDYYQIKLGDEPQDTAGPMLVISALETAKSGDPIEVSVQTSDISGVSSVVYAKGNLTEYDSGWGSASAVYNQKFTVRENGEYSVMVKDRKGNITIKHIRIGNIDPNVANTPKVSKVKNSYTEVKGSASANAKVYVQTSTGVYETTTAGDGTYVCPVEGLLAGKKIYVWQIDAKERTSEKVAVKVERGGANKPIIDEITNKKSAVTGMLNDSGYCKVVAIRSKKVYIPKGQKSKYKNSKIYKKNKTKKIVETDYSYDSNTKEFKLSVPKIYADQKITVLSYDWIGRSSLSEKYKVEDVAPNQPVIETVVAQEGKVYGYVPSPKAESYNIKTEIDGTTYAGTAGSDGKFLIDTKAVSAGIKVKVNASDVDINGKKRTSKKAFAKAINSFEGLKKKSVSKADIDEMNNKDTTISGYITASPTDIVSLIMGSKHYSITYDENGEFKYKLEEPKKVGAKIGILIRKQDGTIKSYNYIKVTLAKPDAPIFVTDKVDTDTKKVMIKTTEKAKGILRVGKKRYKSKKIKKKVKGDTTWYYHTFKIKEPKKGKKVIAYLQNKTGYGKKTLLGKVKKGKKKKK